MYNPHESLAFCFLRDDFHAESARHNATTKANGWLLNALDEIARHPELQVIADKLSQITVEVAVLMEQQQARLQEQRLRLDEILRVEDSAKAAMHNSTFDVTELVRSQAAAAIAQQEA